MLYITAAFDPMDFFGEGRHGGLIRLRHERKNLFLCQQPIPPVLCETVSWAA